MIGFVYDNSIGNFLGLNETILWEEYILSDKPVDILSFDNIFIHTDIAQGMIFRGKRSVIIHKFTLDISPGYNYVERFRGGLQWYLMRSKDIFSRICFKLKNENIELVSFNSQPMTFGLSIKEN